MFISRDQYDIQYSNLTCPKCEIIDEEWCNLPSTKYSSSKWKKLAISLYKAGYNLYVRHAGCSKYLYVAGETKALKVRVSNHRVNAHISARPSKRRYWNKKFGNTGLLVGPDGVSAKDAYLLIKETL